MVDSAHGGLPVIKKFAVEIMDQCGVLSSIMGHVFMGDMLGFQSLK